MIKTLLLLLTAQAMMCDRVYWEDNLDLVEESVHIQGREHIKLMVAMIGDTIDLKCNVISSQQTVNGITWKINGETQTKPYNQTVETKGKMSLLKDHLEIANITEEMDGDRVSCESEGRAEAILQVYKLEVQASEEICETCQGNANLVFKKCKNNLGDENVEKKVKTKISMITNTEAVGLFRDTFGFYVNIPISAVMANREILAMKPKIIKDGIISDTWDGCNCESGGQNVATSTGFAAGVIFLLLVIAALVIAAVVIAYVMLKKGTGENLCFYKLTSVTCQQPEKCDRAVRGAEQWGKQSEYEYEYE